MIQPFGNTTTLPPAEWHPEPLFRGTSSILSSCLITMSLCIWSSIHLNISENKKEHLQTYRKIGWMVLGLLAPELIVWNAWVQRKKVKGLSEKMEEEEMMSWRFSTYDRLYIWIFKAWRWLRICLLLEAETAPTSRPHRPFKGRIHAWSDAHSWIVAMGGMAFEDTAPTDQQFMPEGRQRIPLTPEVLYWMIENVPEWPRLIPDISQETIEDKNKSDRLTRALTCWQASYFCIQCTFRLSQRLSITLLELNVFAHAICALLLFLIWWHKPRDIREPFLIHHDDALDVCAYVHRPLAVDRRATRRGMYDTMRFIPMFNPHPVHECLEITEPRSFTVATYDAYPWSTLYDCVAISGHVCFDFLKLKNTYWTLDLDGNASRQSLPLNDETSLVTLNSYDINRMVRAYEFWKRCPRLCEDICSYNGPRGPRILNRISDWSLDAMIILSLMPHRLGTLTEPSFGWLILGRSFAGGCYGALHLSAWAALFPSYAETLLWRASSVTILASGPSCALVVTLYTLVSEPFRRLSQPSKRSLNWILEIYGWIHNSIFTVLPLFWYIFCRAFIVVECFIQLVHIPDSALNVPTWSGYIPHIV